MSNTKPRINCKNGVSLSVQASQDHYCTPRADGFGAWQQYNAVEVGYIERYGESLKPPESWREYGDGGFPSSVYGYVPTDLVEAFIKDNGGSKA